MMEHERQALAKLEAAAQERFADCAVTYVRGPSAHAERSYSLRLHEPVLDLLMVVKWPPSVLETASPSAAVHVDAKLDMLELRWRMSLSFMQWAAPVYVAWRRERDDALMDSLYATRSGGACDA